MQDDLTSAQKILVAALELEKGGNPTFTAELLTVIAWKKWPQTFGLKGFREHYPCSNSTFTVFMGKRSLVARGWLVKLGPKQYALSQHGRAEAQAILDADVAEPARRPLAKIRFPRDLEERLVALINSKAFLRYQEGMEELINYPDACRFWSLDSSLHGDDLDRRVAATFDNLKTATGLIVGDEMEISTGMVITRTDLAELAEFHHWLRHAFANKLKQQRENSFRRIGA